MDNEIKNCRICGGNDFSFIIDLGVQAFTGIFPKKIDDPVPTGKLELVKCMTCGLVQLKNSFDLNLMYGFNYGYRSGLNSSMVEHLHATVRKIMKKIDLVPGDLVVDIGSNDSTTLQGYPSNLDLVGVDPTGKKFRKYYPDHIRLIPDFFSAGTVSDFTGGKKARIVTSIAMFYDLEEPMKFMSEIYNVLDDNGIWYFEQSYLPEMIKKNSYDTICHEHLEYYCLKQIKWMADRTGFRIMDVNINDINGGSFNITVCKDKAPYCGNDEKINRMLQAEIDEGYDGLEIFQEFKNRILKHREALINFFDDARKKGKKIFGYGASTKGNVLLQYCGITSDVMEFIAEVNEDKFGSFTPGSRIPIISEKEARAHKPDYFLVLPWHFRNNIIAREREYLKSGGHLIFPLPFFEII